MPQRDQPRIVLGTRDFLAHITARRWWDWRSDQNPYRPFGSVGIKISLVWSPVALSSMCPAGNRAQSTRPIYMHSTPHVCHARTVDQLPHRDTDPKRIFLGAETAVLEVYGNRSGHLLLWTRPKSRAVPEDPCLRVPTGASIGEIGRPPAWQATARILAATGTRLMNTGIVSVHATTTSEAQREGIDSFSASRAVPYRPGGSCPNKLGMPQRPTSGEIDGSQATRPTASKPLNVGSDSYSATLGTTQKAIRGGGYSCPTCLGVAGSVSGGSFEVIA
mgnify:CR=1 FL=1